MTGQVRVFLVGEVCTTGGLLLGRSTGWWNCPCLWTISPPHCGVGWCSTQAPGRRPRVPGRPLQGFWQSAPTGGHSYALATGALAHRLGVR